MPRHTCRTVRVLSINCLYAWRWIQWPDLSWANKVASFLETTSSRSKKINKYINKNFFLEKKVRTNAQHRLLSTQPHCCARQPNDVISVLAVSDIGAGHFPYRTFPDLGRSSAACLGSFAQFTLLPGNATNLAWHRLYNWLYKRL